jgi:hypothetical protein
MKHTHDKQHRELKFEVGDWVWLRLNHWAASSVRQGDKSKLGTKYFGLYMVLDCIGDVSYKLQLPPQARIHNVFLVSFLKKFQGDPPAMPPALPPMVRGRVVSVPDMIIRTKPTASSWELLVRWQGRDAVEASWMLLEQFKEEFPDFQLEDELFCQAGGSVVDSFGSKNSRKNKSQLRNRISCNQEVILVGLLEPLWLIPEL